MIYDHQYNLFINTAHYYGCNIHILGMTRFGLINQLNLGKDDSFDSSSWKQGGIFGKLTAPSYDNNIQKFILLRRVQNGL